MEHDLILARYGEIGLKSRPVRRRFENLLRDNIEYAFETNELDVIVKRIPGRFLVMTSDVTRGVEILTRVFGLTSVSPVRRVKSDLETLLPATVDYAKAWRSENDAKTFAVRSRRSGTHAYTSQDVAVKVGAAVLEDKEAGAALKVNLDEADFELHVEVRGGEAFLFADKVRGPGGLPLGSAGRVVALIKDRASAVAAWLMMKRGCTVLPVHFEGPTGRPEVAAALHEALKGWYLRAGLKSLPHEETEAFPAKDACALCMRQMVRKAASYAGRRKARTLVTGETLASTTVVHMSLVGGVSDMAVLRPLMGLLPEMVAEMAARIGLPEAEATKLQEPCPLRVAGPVDAARVEEYEAESGLVATRTTTSGGTS